MNTDDRLLQILENSSCLSKGQMTGYLKHTLYPEELRAVELHLSSCALCNDALEGMETQLDVDQLLASMTPPVLPNITAPKEKTKEKKEVPATTRSEKAETVVPLAKTNTQHTSEADNKNDTHTNPFRPRRRWARPIGIAAALALAFGALWYFKFNKENSERQIAQHINQAPDTEPANNMNPEQQNAIQTVVPGQQDSLNRIADKKHSDSVYLARKEDQKKAKADSLSMALAATGDSDKSIAAENQSGAVAKTAEPDEKEQAEVATKRVAAAPAISKAKEKENKDDPTDFELGLQKYKQKNYASALLYFKSAESDKGDPKHWEAVYYSGLCNKLLNKERKARKLFERIVDAGVPLKKSAQKQLDEMEKANR